MCTLGRALDLLEFSENALQLLTWNTTSGIRDNDLDSDVSGIAQTSRLVELASQDGDLTLGRVFHCPKTISIIGRARNAVRLTSVGRQVRNNCLNLLTVTNDMYGTILETDVEL